MQVRHVLLLLALALLANGPAAARQDPAPSAAAPQPTFRGGVNVVRVDVIVTDRSGNPVTSLTRDDFEVFEDGRAQTVEQFRLVAADSGEDEALPARDLRTRDDELIDAAREDVRVFAILLDDYHIPRLRSTAVREALTTFIRTQVRPNDLLAIAFPLTPVTTLTFTRDHDSVVQAIRQFEGRKGDYTPRNPVEEQHWRNLPAIERIRTEVVLDALSALSVRLGSLREGRKSLIVVGEGFAGGGAGDLRLRDVARDANRHNVSIYPFNPCGLTVAGGMTDGRDCSPGRRLRDSLLYLAEETDGRAFVNRNQLADGLAQVARDSSAYYLIGYTSTRQASDGKFHPISVRVKARGVDVRARKGYWAMTEADAARAATPVPAALTPVRRALASIDLAADARRYVRTWIGTSRGENGSTRVTISWELLPRRDRQAWEQPGALAVVAGGGDGPVRFRGGGPIEPGAREVSFEIAPGRLDIRLAVESAANGETLDRELVAVDVPDLGSPAARLSTPRVFAARTANEFRAAAADAAAVPIARREFLRSERLLIRFDAYAPGTLPGRITAALLNSNGDRMLDVPTSPAQAGGTHQIAFGLAGLAPGDYVIEITAAGAAGESKELVPFRVRT